MSIVERLGRYKATKEAGLAVLVPFVDRVREQVDMREQVVTFPPQSVITQDNLTVHVDTVVYYKVIDPKSALYGVANFIDGVQNVTTTTLRNVVGGLSLEQTLTSREQINTALRGELDEATHRWGIRINRVENGGTFRVRTQLSADQARVVDAQVDPGQLCRGQTVTGRWDIAFTGPDSGTVTFEASALDIGGRELASTSSTSRVVSPVAATPSETPSATETDAPDDTADIIFGVLPRTFWNLSLVHASDVATGLTKCVAYGAAIPIVSSHCGLSTFGGSEGVGSATTRAVVQSSLAVIVLNFIISSAAFLVFK